MYALRNLKLLKREVKNTFLRPGGIVKNFHPGGATETKLLFFAYVRSKVQLGVENKFRMCL